MKSITKKLLTAAAALTIGAAGIASAQTTLEDIQERGYIQIATANEVPYGYVNAAGEAEGIAPDVATAVLNNLGIDDIQWVVTQFGSLIPGLIADRFDMVAAEQAILPDRCAQVLFSTPSSSYGEGMLVAAGNPEGITSYDDFVDNPNLLMGIMSGADQLDFAQAYGIDQSQLVMIPTNQDALSAVEAGRVHAYAATGLTVANLAENSDRVEPAEGFQTPVIGGEPIRSWGGFTFKLENEELRDAFNAELEAFQQTDEYREILTSYGLSDVDVDEALAASTEDLCNVDHF